MQLHHRLLYHNIPHAVATAQIDDGEAMMTAYLQDADNLAAAKKMLTALDLISTGADGQAQTVGVNERAEKTGACCSVLSDGDRPPGYTWRHLCRIRALCRDSRSATLLTASWGFRGP